MAHSKHPNPNHPEDEAPRKRDAADPAAESAIEAIVAEPGVRPTPEQFLELQAEKDELLKTLVRRQADFENYRKRVEREAQESTNRGVGRVIEELLPVLDAFDRAIAAHDDPAYEEYRKGFEMIYSQLWSVLSRQGLVRVEARGEPFDPHVHQAVDRVETEEHADGTVLEVLQQGYTLRGRVLRPAVVRVAVHPVTKAPSDEDFLN